MDAQTEPPLVVRPGTSDGFVAREHCYTQFYSKVQGLVVLDLGSYIGTTVREAFHHGARRVIAVEPDPQNFDLLLQNTRHLENVNYIPAAVLPFEVDEVAFYQSKDHRYAAGHTVRAKRGYERITVRAVSINTLIRNYRPDAIKIDVEHVEAQVVLAAKLDGIDLLSVEYSFGRKEDVPICTQAHTYLQEDQSFTAFGKFNPRNWSSVVTYRRGPLL